MRRFILTLLATTTLLACGGESGPAGGVVAKADILGTWRFTTTLPTPCASGVAGTIVTTITPDALPDNPTGVTIGLPSWTFAENPQWNGFISGQVELPGGAVVFQVWRHVVNSHMDPALVNGTFSENGTFTGTLRDPSPLYDPIFSLGCTFQVTGTRE